MASFSDRARQSVQAELQDLRQLFQTGPQEGSHSFQTDLEPLMRMLQSIKSEVKDIQLKQADDIQRERDPFEDEMDEFYQELDKPFNEVLKDLLDKKPGTKSYIPRSKYDLYDQWQLKINAAIDKWVDDHPTPFHEKFGNFLKGKTDSMLDSIRHIDLLNVFGDNMDPEPLPRSTRPTVPQEMSWQATATVPIIQDDVDTLLSMSQDLLLCCASVKQGCSEVSEDVKYIKNHLPSTSDLDVSSIRSAIREEIRRYPSQ